MKNKTCERRKRCDRRERNRSECRLLARSKRAGGILPISRVRSCRCCNGCSVLVVRVFLFVPARFTDIVHSGWYVYYAKPFRVRTANLQAGEWRPPCQLTRTSINNFQRKKISQCTPYCNLRVPASLLKFSKCSEHGRIFGAPSVYYLVRRKASIPAPEGWYTKVENIFERQKAIQQTAPKLRKNIMGGKLSSHICVPNTINALNTSASLRLISLEH